MRTQESAARVEPAAAAVLAERLLAWYDRNARPLPWRVEGDGPPDPYRIWLSEVMLQQTTVATVIPYYHQFLARWPDVGQLAAAPLESVLEAWAGLGYYARARNLHACARTLVARHQGNFPETLDGLRRLPGIGAYTAAAIAAIVFAQPVVAVDGNVERVVARLFAVDAALPGSKPQLAALAQTLAPSWRCGDFAQAVMELGATVCRPRRLLCGECPWRESCRGYAAGTPETFPRRQRKAPSPQRYGQVFWLERADGAVWLRRRPPSGLLGGMLELPGSPWPEPQPGFLTAGLAAAGLGAVAGWLASPRRWVCCPTKVAHVFSHFRLELTIWLCRLDGVAEPDLSGFSTAGDWFRPEQWADLGLPGLMRKVFAAVAGFRQKTG